jgi:spermidine synthase
MAPALQPSPLPPDTRILAEQRGPTAHAVVLEDSAGVRSLHIDFRAQEGSTATYRADARQAWLPLLLHPAPSSALFLGVGTGVTATAAAALPGLSVTGVELLPEVLALTPWFHDAPPPPGLRWVAADARRHVRTTEQHYDVIVADNVHPARSGSGALLTREHFEAIRQRLAPGGLFCQWLPLHQMDPTTVRSVVRSFQAVYPDARAVLATQSLLTPVLGLVAREGGWQVDAAALDARLGQLQALDGGPAAIGLDTPWAVLGSVVAGPRALARLAADAPLNTDDRPVVTYLAPRATYAPEATPADRLLALMGALEVTPDEALPGADDAQHRRVERYGDALRLFLKAGRHVAPSADVRDMLAQVHAPLTAVLRASPDFHAARDPLLRMAVELSRVDVTQAAALLHELEQLLPGDPTVRRALDARSATLP